ncbi:MAG: hypothetical protein WD928_06475 [Gammaproteobacteria bacterium]
MTDLAIPDWAADMAAGHWYRLSGDEPDLGWGPTPLGTRYLEDNDPAHDVALNPARTPKESLRRLLRREWQAPWSGRCGFPAITEAWNSAVYASRLGPAGAMLVFGGGHDDYFGSDMHAFDLASRQWRRLTTGYIEGEAADYGAGAVYADSIYPDGSPLPPHTYGYVQYDAARGLYLLLKGQLELGPDVVSAPVPHLFAPETCTWLRGPRHPTAVIDSGGCSTWDAARRLLWGHSGDDGGGNAFVAYSPDGENGDGSQGCWVHDLPGKLPGEANHNAMQIHPGADLIVMAVHQRDALAALTPERPEAPLEAVRSQGSRPKLQPYAALDYAPALEALIYYSAVDGAGLYAIEWDGCAHWRCLSAPDSLDPIADAAACSRHRVNRAHTFGRLRIASFAECDVAVLVRHVDSPVYAMRLPG